VIKIGHNRQRSISSRTSTNLNLVIDSSVFWDLAQEAALDERTKELLTFTEEDAKRWDDAANHCERIAANLPQEHRAALELQCAVYRERAKMHRDLFAKLKA
jgi:hypothetical protein